ncbi:MAG TPA: capsular polysaccharide synthesis protein [Euzebyales bacterium]
MALPARLGARTCTQWDAAAEAYAAAVALERDNAQFHYRLGRVHHRAGRWAVAADRYRAALELDDSVDVWRERLAHVLGLMGDADGMRRAAVDIADRAGDRTPAERRLLTDDPLRFGVRRRLLQFIAEHIDEIRAGAVNDQPVSRDAPSRVWMYWGQGIAHAPAVVRRCHAALLRHHDPAQVMVLDDDTVDDHVDIPGYVRDRTRGDRTKFSDVLRIDLLARHGGVWLDATCLVRRNVLALLPELLTAGFFAPRSRRTRIASWFMASDPGGHVITALRSAQLAYWRHHAEAIDYYVLHHLFEALCHTDPTVAACCERMPMLRLSDLSRFARAMFDPYDPERFRQLIDSAPVHKLTYKRLQRGLDLGDTMVSHLLDDETEAAAQSASTRTS